MKSIVLKILGGIVFAFSLTLLIVAKTIFTFFSIVYENLSQTHFGRRALSMFRIGEPLWVIVRICFLLSTMHIFLVNPYGIAFYLSIMFLSGLDLYIIIKNISSIWDEIRRTRLFLKQFQSYPPEEKLPLAESVREYIKKEHNSMLMYSYFWLIDEGQTTYTPSSVQKKARVLYLHIKARFNKHNNQELFNYQFAFLNVMVKTIKQDYQSKNNSHWPDVRLDDEAFWNGHKTPAPKAITMDRAWALNILGVPNDADKEQIKKAWRALVKSNHPDVNKNTNLEKFLNIQKAYEILS